MEPETHPTDLLPAYALEILDPAEQTEVQAHLDSCSNCRAELAALIEVTSLLSLAVPQMEPPEKLRTELLKETGPSTANDSWWQRTAPCLRQFMSSPFVRPVAAGLIVLLIISNIYLLFRLQQSGNQPPPQQQTIELGNTSVAPQASGIMLIRQDDPNGTLVVNGLPDLGSDQQYQLWLVKDEVRVSGAVFSVEEEGFTSINISAPESLPLYTRFGITIEPAGGSPGPTGDGVLLWTAPGSE
jgi:anti-sigma-K factor RskA